MNRFRFWWRYVRRKIPWDTGITPPEIVALADDLTPGRALDLGCGTGTSSLFLASRGWQVTGIDFVPIAIQRARQNARERALNVDFRVGDVCHLPELRDPYDLAVDVGCFHSLRLDQRPAYAATLARLTRSGATYALYDFGPRLLNGQLMGVTPEDVRQIFAAHFVVEKFVEGQDTSGGSPSAWYWLRCG